MIARFEGFRPHLYNDAAGHCTIGFGHLVHHGPCDGTEAEHLRAGLSRQDALALLREDVAAKAGLVRDAVKVPLNQRQFDALVSFVFNVGEGNFGRSTLLRRLNAGKYDAVPAELRRWVKAGGRTLQGLVRRRAAEAALFAAETDDRQAEASSSEQPKPLDVADALRKIGFPLPSSPSAKQLHETIGDFQRGWAFWRLQVDGFAGPKTQRSLRTCLKNGGRCSENFWYREFESKGKSDTTIKVQRALVLGLEEYRSRFGPVSVVSGYRDPAHNHSVGGAANSQHLYGNGADIPQRATVPQVRELRCFSGIGFDGASGLVRHVDVRHVGPNTTGGSPEEPTVWRY
jgi:GH24 family phage-related lysozyme (muramidase)